MEFAELHDVEIFEAGSYVDGNGNHVTYTEDDLRRTVEIQKELADNVKPPLKLGHDKDQEFARRSGYPSTGWLDKAKGLYLNGSKLVAKTITDVPKGVYDAVKNKAYKRISAEFYNDFSHDGKNYGKNVLKGIALLGEDIPIVKTLEDVSVYSEGKTYDSVEHGLIMFSEDTQTDYTKEKEMPEPKEEKVLTFSEDELQSKISAAVKTAITEYDEAQKPVIESIQNENKELREANKDSKVDIFCEKNLDKITPKRMPLVKEILKRVDSNEEFKFGEEEVTTFDLVKQLIDNMKGVEFSEKLKDKPEEEKTDSDKSLPIQFGEAVEKKVNEDKMDWATAARAVRKENPEFDEIYKGE